MSGIDALVGQREIASAVAMEAFGEELGRMLRPGDLLVLTGALGAGKTTLTRGLARALDVRGPIQSPTFVIARTHPSLSGGAPLVHVDAYRLGDAAELDDLDIDFERSIVVAEWAAPFAASVADVWWEVQIERDAAALAAAPAEDLDAETPRLVTVTRHDH